MVSRALLWLGSGSDPKAILLPVNGRSRWSRPILGWFRPFPTVFDDGAAPGAQLMRIGMMTYRKGSFVFRTPGLSSSINSK